MTISLTISPEQLTVSGINKLACSIAEQVMSQVSNNVVRYAIIKSLSKAAEDAITPCIKQEATHAAELVHEQFNHVGSEVLIEGLTFQVKHSLVYDYGRVRGWAAAGREIDKQKKILDAMTVRRKAIEKEAALRLKPISDRVSIAFIPADK